jgi:hypothetical protein
MKAWFLVFVKFSYAFTAAATRGSAGAELLVDGGGVDAELVDADVEVPEVLGVLGVVAWLSDALGPGFGELLLHPATTAAATVAATSATKGDLRTGPPVRGDAAVLWGVTPAASGVTVTAG